ncbi:hypothetical protein ACRCUN_19450 [Mycobacterium sp. LTG2003]
MQLPEVPAPRPVDTGVVAAAPPGLAAAVAAVPPPPIVIPIVVPPVVVPPIAGPGNPDDNDRPNGPDRQPDVTATLKQQQPTSGGPLAVGYDAAVPPASFRVGYTDYLRTAGVFEIAAVAVPGVAGILGLTGLGGLVGYRQAKAALSVRNGTTRFMS